LSFDDQIGAALDSTAASLREHLEAELRAVSREAARLAGEDRQQAMKAAEAASAEVRAQAEAQVAQMRAAAQKHAEELKRAAETQITELRKALEELRTQAQQQLETARRVAQAEIDKAHAEIQTVHAEVEKAHAEIQTAHTEVEKAQAEVEKAQAGLEKAHAEIQAAHTESARARSEVESARAEADAARAETEAVRENAKLEVAKAEAAHSVSERNIADAIERARADNDEAELSRAARLVNAIRSLDEARGLSEVLERLVQRAGDEVDRAAVLLVKGDRLTGWRLTGFAPEMPPPNSIDLSIEDAGLAGAVLRTGVAASRPSDADDAVRLPPFAGDSGEHHAMALPVRVGGEVVAVLYADAPRVDEPSSDARWPAILEVLVRHASRVLEAMTVQKAAGLSMPRPMAHGSHAGSAP
jgi:chemotaxis protein histidine kinase CheA